MESSTQKSSRKKGATGIVLGSLAVLGIIGGIIAVTSSGGGGGGGGELLIPVGPITQEEKDACDLVLSWKPQPTSYTDDQGRIWTPCVEWWLGINIPNWPSGMWPGQVPFLHKPVDTAEWLASIAGYLVYKGPLAKAAQETFSDEAKTVDVTQRLSARRDLMREYMIERMAALGRINALSDCDVKDPPVDDPVKDQIKNPPANDPAKDPPSPDDLTFDLEGNWGHVPVDLRPWLAKLELASGIPGIARAAGVRWWESFRAKKPVVTTAEAKVIAAANPELARFLVNLADGPAAKKAIDDDITKQGWPKPTDYDGWIKGSFGLGDILGSTMVYSGIHTEGKKAGPSGLPFVFAKDAEKTWKSYEAQCAALGYIVYRVIYGDLKVLVPGIKAQPAQQDSEKTWINIFAAYAYPAAFKANSALAKEAAANYKKRAAEIGVDLSKVAYPWPPGMSYTEWDFGDFWARLQLYAPQKVTHLPSVYGAMGQVPVPKAEDAKAKQSAKKIALQGNVQASIASAIPDGASSPMVIFLHDRDGDETQLAKLVFPDQVDARLSYLRGPLAGGAGYRWFDNSAIPAEIEGASNVVLAAIQELVSLYPATTQVYVVGYGQGGAIAYRLAARGDVARVLAIAGSLPPSLRMAGNDATETSMVLAVNGQDDQVVLAQDAAATIESFIFRTSAKLDMVPGATHSLASLYSAIGGSLVEMLA